VARCVLRERERESVCSNEILPRQAVGAHNEDRDGTKIQGTASRCVRKSIGRIGSAEEENLYGGEHETRCHADCRAMAWLPNMRPEAGRDEENQMKKSATQRTLRDEPSFGAPAAEKQVTRFARSTAPTTRGGARRVFSDRRAEPCGRKRLAVRERKRKSKPLGRRRTRRKRVSEERQQGPRRRRDSRNKNQWNPSAARNPKMTNDGARVEETEVANPSTSTMGRASARKRGARNR
jgi:hypothetical protein